jgi:hypothetical protein
MGCQMEKGPDEIVFKVLAPLRGATLFGFDPVVFASLQPPATICQPSGLMRLRCRRRDVKFTSTQLL